MLHHSPYRNSTMSSPSPSHISVDSDSHIVPVPILLKVRAPSSTNRRLWSSLKRWWQCPPTSVSCTSPLELHAPLSKDTALAEKSSSSLHEDWPELRNRTKSTPRPTAPNSLPSKSEETP